MTVLIFFVVLFILILVHEWGHFIVAKKTGMRVDEFGIGFPPKLFGIKKGETEYTFNALPIGGFVKILGENAEEGETEADQSRSFVNKSKLAQAAVLIAGVAMNVLFAWLLFIIVFMVGVPSSVDEAHATPEAKLTVTQILPESPAEEAGIPYGAVIVGLSAGIEEETVLTPTSFAAFTQEHTDGPIDIAYTVGGERRTVSVLAEEGVIAGEEGKPAVGVALSLVETVKKPIHVALKDATVVTITSLGAITVGISNLLLDAVLFQADFSQVAGPVGIVGLVGDAAQFGFASLLMFTAIISLNLAVINMLPFPALDGGRLLFVAIEAIMRRPINPVWVSRLNFAGFALLILLMVAVTYSDITKLF